MKSHTPVKFTRSPTAVNDTILACSDILRRSQKYSTKRVYESAFFKLDVACLVRLRAWVNGIIVFNGPGKRQQCNTIVSYVVSYSTSHAKYFGWLVRRTQSTPFGWLNFYFAPSSSDRTPQTTFATRESERARSSCTVRVLKCAG